MQLSFSFSTNKDIYDVRNFIVHNGNRSIFDFITSSFLLNNNIYLLTGSKSSGKTYICTIWNRLKKAEFLDKNIFIKEEKDFLQEIKNKIKDSGKYILEDIENINIKEKYLLYLINIVIENNAILLITSKKYLDEFYFNIPDLESRFKNIYNFVLLDIDSSSKEQILLKLLTDKQINIDFRILNYISEKISNNYEEIIHFIQKLDQEIQTNKIKKITISTVNKIIHQ